MICFNLYFLFTGVYLFCDVFFFLASWKLTLYFNEIVSLIWKCAREENWKFLVSFYKAVIDVCICFSCSLRENCIFSLYFGLRSWSNFLFELKTCGAFVWKLCKWSFIFYEFHRFVVKSLFPFEFHFPEGADKLLFFTSS